MSKMRWAVSALLAASVSACAHGSAGAPGQTAAASQPAEPRWEEPSYPSFAQRAGTTTAPPSDQIVSAPVVSEPVVCDPWSKDPARVCDISEAVHGTMGRTNP